MIGIDLNLVGGGVVRNVGRRDSRDFAEIDATTLRGRTETVSVYQLR